jgi:hypothetical protein
VDLFAAGSALIGLLSRERATTVTSAWLMLLAALWLLDAWLEPRMAAADDAGSYPDPTAVDALLVLYAGLATGLMLVLPWFMDRYIVCLAPVAVVLVYRWRLDGGPAWARGALIALAVWTSVAGTASYFAWSDARWQLACEVVRVHALAPSDVDGGFEWAVTAALDDSLTDRSRGMARPPERGAASGGLVQVLAPARATRFARPDEATPWWISMTRLPAPCFSIAWTPLPGWSIVKESWYDRPFGLGRGRLYVLRRPAKR